MSSGFVSEAELAEARQKRQEEWEKVRTADQPMERPEEPYDSRSLFDRLKEQRDKKNLEYEETHKLKNMIRGLNDDEVDFLSIVDQAKVDAERRQQIEEHNELRDFRERVATLQESSIDQKISTGKATPKVNATKTSARPTQKSILAGIVRKRTANEALDGSSNKSTSTDIPVKESKATEMHAVTTTQSVDVTDSNVSSTTAGVNNEGALKCIGILPGIGKYEDSSDSDRSTDTDDEYDFRDYDWIGRKIKKNDGQCNE